MKPRTLLKTLTVGLFVLLIAAFVLYKSGYFDKKPEAGAVASATADSTSYTPRVIQIDSFWMDPMMSSSKSMPAMSPVTESQGRPFPAESEKAFDSISKEIPSH